MSVAKLTVSIQALQTVGWFHGCCPKGSRAVQHAATFRHHALAKKKKEVQPFNWGLLWEMLKPDVYLLGAAVVAAIAVAVINVQIPTVLGEVSAMAVPCQSKISMPHLPLSMSPSTAVSLTFA